MMKRDILLVILISLVVYNAVPLINLLFPASVLYTFLTDLWILNAFFSLVCPIFFCRKYGFQFWISFVICAMFLVTMFLFYNASAFLFFVIYLVLSLIGCGIGAGLHRLKRRKNAENAADCMPKA